jgi:carbon storage regulator
MLVLTRKVKERIFINDDIVITVIRLSGDRVQIGIEAPTEAKVHREEVYHKIKERNMSKK